jgi:VWFA-related protein
MTRRASLPLALACLSLGASLLATQQATFRASVNVVAVDAVVMRGRNPVIDLEARDFRVTDNGVVQDILSVSQGNIPLDITVVLDFSESAEDEFPRFVQSAEGMQRVLRDEDRWQWLGVFSEARVILPLRRATDPLPAIARPGRVPMSAIHDTLFLALARPGEPERRHLVVVFTDGNDTWSMLDPKQLPGIADKADAVLHVVVSASPPAGQQVTGFAGVDARRWRESQDALFDAARRSGGAVHRLADRAAAFAKIIEDFRSAYVLRYTPRGVDTPGWHEVAVSVTRPGAFSIRARKGYERGTAP